MSEYGEAHTVSRLIGAPAGYVGHEKGGLLSEAIKKHPHSVLLLDEIEKAHPELLNILLQVMDNATITDNNGYQSGLSKCYHHYDFQFRGKKCQCDGIYKRFYISTQIKQSKTFSHQNLEIDSMK
jgi:hypothetical protein